MSRTYFYGLGTLLLVAACFFALSWYLSEGRGNPGAYAVFTNEDVGIRFEYRTDPEGYYFDEPQPIALPHPNYVTQYILMLEKDREELSSATGPREGPPTITITIFKNPERMLPGAWVALNSALSNVGLLVGDIQEEVVGGANAVRYTVDGLYRADTVVVAHGGYIILISGSYLDEQSTIRKDFDPFVTSVSFIPQNATTFADGEHLGFIHAVGTGSDGYIEFDDAVWLSGTEGEDAAIRRGVCTEATRAECLPNDYFIENETKEDETIPLDQKALFSMQTWKAGDQGIKKQPISLAGFASLINDDTLQWRMLPYLVTVQQGRVIRIEEVYIP